MNKKRINRESYGGKSTVRRLSSRLAALFDSGLVARFCDSLRDSFFGLRLRVVGTFFLTFGLYGVIVSLLSNLFDGIATDDTGVYFGVTMAVCAIPLLLSNGNISSAKNESVSGKVFCKFFGIRYETNVREKMSGHYSVAFILGVAAGVLSLFVPIKTILGILLLTVAVCFIFASPEAGLAFGVITMLFAENNIYGVIICTTALSFFIKLIRGKRSAKLSAADLSLVILAIYIFAAALFGGGGSKSFELILLMLPYFLTVLMEKECRRATRLMAVVAVSSGIAFALYDLAVAVKLLTAKIDFADSDFLIDSVGALPLFSGGFAPVVCAAVIPLTLGLAFRKKTYVSKTTLWFCTLVDIGYLAVTGEWACLAAGIIPTVVLILLIGKRWVYVSVCAVLLAFGALFYIGETGKMLYSVVARAISNALAGADIGGADAVQTMSERYLFCGTGLGNSAGHGDFYNYLFVSLGIIGIILFAGFICFIISECIKTFAKTARFDQKKDDIHRFGVLVGSVDTRLGAGAPICSVLAVFICGAFTNIWASPLTYSLLWIMCALGASYSRAAYSELCKAERAEEAVNTPETAALSLRK